MKIDLTKQIHKHFINTSLSGKKVSITYCEAELSYTLMHFTSGKSMKISYCLNKVQKKLPNKNFVRCHRSYLVNINEVKKVSFKEKVFILKNKDRISISRRRMKDVTKHLIDYFKVESIFD